MIPNFVKTLFQYNMCINKIKLDYFSRPIIKLAYYIAENDFFRTLPVVLGLWVGGPKYLILEGGRAGSSWYTGVDRHRVLYYPNIF